MNTNPLVTLPPAVLTERPAPHLSARYAHVHSGQLVDALAGEGYQLHSVLARKTRRADPLYARHQLDLRHPDAPRLDGVQMRILLTNSHDGSSGVHLAAGAFRFVCSNGLVIGTTVGAFKLRHAKSAAEQVIDRVRDLARRSTDFVRTVEDWSRKELSEAEALEFARGAAVLRFGDVNRFDPATLLETVRPEDEGRSLWRVFNRVQEATTQRRLTGFSAEGRRLASAPLASVERVLGYNAQLWDLAAEFA